MAQPAAQQQLTVADLDEVESALLDALQNAFPIAARPFQVMAEKLGISEDDVLAKVQKFKDGGVIRQVSPIFDTKSLGYKSSLVAGKYPADRLDAAAEVVNQHPGVSHNYGRNHEFNLWYTVAIPPDSQLGLQGTCDRIHEESGAEKTRVLPTLKLFKIGVDLDMTGKREAGARAKAHYTEGDRGTPDAVSDEERRVISESQWDMAVVAEPWKVPAEKAGVSVARLLEVLEGLQAKGQLRRVAAVLFHRRMGFRANGMGVWKVPEERVEEVGPIMGSFRNVSHCYLRPTYEDWPYNLFSMVHGKTKEECEEILDAIAAETGIMDRTSLYSTKEFKKTRVPYFTQAMVDWERERAKV